MGMVGYLAGFLLVLWAFRYLVPVLRGTMGRPGHRIRESGTLLQGLRGRADAYLEPLGFRFILLVEEDPRFFDSGAAHLGLIYHHEESGSYADVWLAPAAPPYVQFLTVLVDESVLLTSGNSHFRPATAEVRAYSESGSITPEEAWTAHRAELERLGMAPLRLDPDRFMAAVEVAWDGVFEPLLRQGKVRQSPNGRLKVRFLEALRWAWQAMHNRPQLPWIPHTATMTLLPGVEAHDYIEADVLALGEKLAARATGKPPAWVFWGSLLLFFGVWSGMYEWDFIAAVLIVIFLHECGHMLAMKAFGYQDTTIFFIPLFGGAATGKKHDASVHERIVVLLAGPVPGLVLALGAYLWAMASGNSLQSLGFLGELWFLLWFVNLVNLFPILPLDGGRIVNLLIFSRNPYAELVFNLFAVGCLLAAGLALGDKILFFLALLVAISIPGTFKIATIADSLNRLQPVYGYDSPEYLRDIFECVHRDFPAATARHVKIGLAEQVYLRVRQTAPGVGPTLLWLVVYAGSIAMGLALPVAAYLQGGI